MFVYGFGSMFLRGRSDLPRKGKPANWLSPIVIEYPRAFYSCTAEYLVACCQDECGQMRMAEIEKDIR